MYKEPHLQRKSDECAEMWREWFYVKYTVKDKEKAKLLRQTWCQCCTEFSEMISQELKINPRYKNVDFR